MKILHMEDCSGYPLQLANAQRDMGHVASTLYTYQGPYPWSACDYPNPYSGPLTPIRMLRTVSIGRRYDIIHAHHGLAKRRIDYSLLHRLGCHIVAHYRGSDTRMGYGMHHQDIVSAKIVSTADLLDWHKDAQLIPNPVPLMATGPLSDRRPTIVHMPTHRRMKGTDNILAAIALLRKERDDFNFALVEGRPRSEAIATLARSDILIDQATIESESGVPPQMGNTSLEAMSMGKVAVCHMLDRYLERYDHCPLVQVPPDPEGMARQLNALLDDPERRRMLGAAGRDYIARCHDPAAIAQRTLEVYEEVLA